MQNDADKIVKTINDLKMAINIDDPRSGSSIVGELRVLNKTLSAIHIDLLEINKNNTRDDPQELFKFRHYDLLVVF